MNKKEIAPVGEEKDTADGKAVAVADVVPPAEHGDNERDASINDEDEDDEVVDDDDNDDDDDDDDDDDG